MSQRNVLVAILAIFFVFILPHLTGCTTVGGPGMEYVDNHSEKPKVWVKDGLSRDQMISDSLQCQDAAIAHDSSYDSYTSTAGFTSKQVVYYDACMAAKGYHNPSEKEIKAHVEKQNER